MCVCVCRIALVKTGLLTPAVCVCLAEREEMISCVYVSREEERVSVAFSKPVHVSES